MLANYHTHTYRCMHATGEDRDYVEAAIKNGFKVLGFSDHCPWIYGDGFVSRTRMAPELLEDYVTSISRLREEYKKDITIYIGLESEYIEELVDTQQQLFKNYSLDYMILGQHSIGPENKQPYTGNITESEEQLSEYVRLVMKGIDTKRYRYIAHPDLINYVGDNHIYEKYMTKICEYMKLHRIPIEINMLGYNGKRNYPCDRFLNIAKNVGNMAIVGVDAHDPKHLFDTENQKRCKEYAQSFGLTVIDYLEGLGPKL